MVINHIIVNWYISWFLNLIPSYDVSNPDMLSFSLNICNFSLSSRHVEQKSFVLVDGSILFHIHTIISAS